MGVEIAADCEMNAWASIHYKTNIFFPPLHPVGSGAHSASYPIHVDLLPELKWPLHDAEHSPLV
jgi:hypothetical protein